MEKWYNYVTKTYETIPTPTDFADYLPQIPEVQNDYRLKINSGIHPCSAACAIMNQIIAQGVSI